MQKSKQERQVNNSSEQLRVTKVELNIVNNELSEALKNKELVLNEILKIKSEVKDLTVVSDRKQKELRVRELELNNKETQLFMKEDDIKRYELDSMALIESEEKKLSSMKRVQNSEVVILTNKINKKQEVLDNLLYDIELNKNFKKEIKSEIKVLSKESNDLDKKLNKDSKELADIVKKLSKEIDIKSKKLADIEEKVLIEQSKIESPLVSLAQQSKLLDRKKHNLDVLITRFNKTFKTHYPTQELKL